MPKRVRTVKSNQTRNNAPDVEVARPDVGTCCVFFGLVVIARAKHPIPSRTRPLSAVAPMVLRLKTWESRSPPNLKRNTPYLSTRSNTKYRPPKPSAGKTGAGWSSPVARQAHNLKVTGSNPVPATKSNKHIKHLHSAPRGAFCIPEFLSTLSQRLKSPPSGGPAALPRAPKKPELRNANSLGLDIRFAYRSRRRTFREVVSNS